jgi:hypothetical protein
MATSFQSSAPFDGATTSKADFTLPAYSRREMMKPISDRLDVSDSRNFQTENAGSYNDQGYQVRRSRAPKTRIGRGYNF